MKTVNKQWQLDGKNVVTGKGNFHDTVCSNGRGGNDVVWIQDGQDCMRRIVEDHNACLGFNPAVMRELAEHCLKNQICFAAWEDKLDEILERLRT